MGDGILVLPRTKQWPEDNRQSLIPIPPPPKTNTLSSTPFIQRLLFFDTTTNLRSSGNQMTLFTMSINGCIWNKQFSKHSNWKSHTWRGDPDLDFDRGLHISQKKVCQANWNLGENAHMLTGQKYLVDLTGDGDLDLETDLETDRSADLLHGTRKRYNIVK